MWIMSNIVYIGWTVWVITFFYVTMATHVTGHNVHTIWEPGLSKIAELILPVWSIYEEKCSLLQQDVHVRLEEGYAVISEGLFKRIIMF